MQNAAADSLFPNLIAIAPSLLWFVFVVILFMLFYGQIRDLLPKISGLKAAGLELSFVREKVTTGIKLAEKAAQWPIRVTAAQRKTITERVSQNADLFQNVSILWADDHPENNVNESAMLQDLKAEVVQVTTNQAVLSLFEKRNFDVVISDIARGDDSAGGLKLAPALRESRHNVPVILYVGDIQPQKGTPPYVFGITNRPDELLHLILDALERRGC